MLLRVLTYNVLDGGVGREKFILEVLHTTQPDIIILQEVFQPDIVDELAKALGMKFFFAKGNSKRHLALLSRLPLVAQESYHPFPPIHTTALETVLEYAPDQHLHVFGVHLIAQPLVIFELWRQWEIKTILQKTRPYHSKPILIAGDFNAIAPHDLVAVTSWPRFLKLMLALQGGRIFRRAIREIMRAGFIDCYRLLHPDERGFTLPPPTPNTRLDYIFVNDVLRNCVQKCYVVQEPKAVEQASDHYPVMVEFNMSLCR